MSWTAPSGHVWTTGEIVSAANMNTYIANNLTDLDRRTTVTAARIDTSESTASTTYVDLATAGPAVTVTIGAAGQGILNMSAGLWNDTATGGAQMAFAVSGATTAGTSDTASLRNTSAAINATIIVGVTYILGGLTAGSNTFTAKYKRVGGANAGFSNRNIIVTPLGA